MIEDLWRESLVPSKDGDLLVRDWGDPDAPPIIFHHGSPSNSLQIPGGWGSPLSAGARLISYDRPGYGGSKRVRGRRVSDVRQWVVDITEALQIDRFATIGVSGGGPFAMATAALLPERVTALCIDVGLGPLEYFNWTEGLPSESVAELQAAKRSENEVRARILEYTQGGADLDLWLEKYPPRDREIESSDTVISEYAEMRKIYGSAVDVDGLIDDERSMIAWPWGAEPAQVKCPTLLAYGAVDPFVPYSHGLAYQRAIPHANISIFGQAGHDLRPEEPDFLMWLASNT